MFTIVTKIVFYSLEILGSLKCSLNQVINIKIAILVKLDHKAKYTNVDLPVRYAGPD